MPQRAFRVRGDTLPSYQIKSPSRDTQSKEYNIMRETIERIDAILDKNLSGRAYDEKLEISHFLRECKIKGFKGLESSGLITQKCKRPLLRPDEERFKIASGAAALMRDDLASITNAAAQFKVSPVTLQAYITEFGLEIPTKSERMATIRANRADREKRETQEKKQERKNIFNKGRALINRQGYTFEKAAAKIGVNRGKLTRIIKENKHVYQGLRIIKDTL